MSGGANYLPKFLPISFFRRVSCFIGVSRHLALQYPKDSAVLKIIRRINSLSAEQQASLHQLHLDLATLWLKLSLA